MKASNRRNGLTAKGVPTIALRISDKELYKRLDKLANSQKISMNMAVNMLLGFAFNEVERQNKKFVPRIVFESKDF